MTYDEITLFRRLMQDKGVMNNFEYLYRTHRFTKMELDEYLEQVNAEDAILSAFDFTGAGNTIFGFKYWKDMDAKWQARLQEYRETGELGIEPVKVFCQHCSRLLPASCFSFTKKGRIHKHCKECECGEWDRKRREAEQAELEARRLEEETGDGQAKPDRTNVDLAKTTKVCDHCGKRKLRSEFYASDTSDDGLQSWCKTCQQGMAGISTIAEAEQERQQRHQQADDSPAEDAPATVTPPAGKVRSERLVAPRLGEYDATMHYKQTQKSITLNATLSAYIREGGFTKCYLNTDRQHRMFLIFNRAEGSSVTGASSLATKLMTVNSADICRALAARFNLEMGDNYYLHITKNLSKTSDFLTVEVLHSRTREEYARIAQRREDAAKGRLPEYEAADDAQAEAVPRPAETPVEDRTPAQDGLIDFRDVLPATADPAAVIDHLVKEGRLSERDLAAYLHRHGWKLQEPVVVTNYKKFTL